MEGCGAMPGDGDARTSELNRRRRTPSVDHVAAAAGVIVALAIAVVAIIALPAHAPPPAPLAPAKLPSDLTLQFAALRGRMTRADEAFQAQVVIDGEPRLPGVRPGARWAVVPGSARLIAHLPARTGGGPVRFYLLAVDVPAGVHPMTAIGGLHDERPAVVVRTGTTGRPIAGAVHGIVLSSGVPDHTPDVAAGYEYVIAPDETSSEEWIFNRGSGPAAWTRPIVVRPTVRHNIAVAAIPSGHPELTTVAAFTVRHLGRSYTYSYESVTLHRPARYPRLCGPAQLRLTVQSVSERTEQMTVLLVLENTGATGCELRGYPTIALRDRRGATLRFRLRRRGDQMITGASPRPVALSPFGLAFAAINKNACVGFTRTVAARLNVTLPGGGRSLTASLTAVPRFDHCGSRDPGHVVDISPFEATEGAVLARPRR
jgi:hypothetical protein